MNIKRITSSILIAAAIPVAVNIVKADTVTLTQGAYSYAVGGEFTAVTSPTTFNGNYASTALMNGGFQTFCLETGVEFSPGSSYAYTLGYTTQPLSGGGSGSDQNLSLGAAWLYYEFGTGALSGYNYDNTVANSRLTDAGLLQSAIWFLQGGQTYSGYANGGTGNIFYDAAVAALGLANVENDYTGTSVQVLQMWTNYDPINGYSGPAQNQLVLNGSTMPTPTPNVPDGGMTVVLLGGAFVGLQMLRRKLAV